MEDDIFLGEANELLQRVYDQATLNGQVTEEIYNDIAKHLDKFFTIQNRP